MNVFDLLTPERMGLYWDKKNIQQDYLLAKKFPRVMVGELSLRMIKGKSGLPVVLEPSAYDAHPSLRDRIGVETIKADLPFFREHMEIREKDIIDIRNFMALNDRATAQAIVANIFDDVGELVRGADARLEQMAWQVVLTGGISVLAKSVEGRNAQYELSYDTDGTWAANNVVTNLTTAKWDEPAATSTADPLKDLEDVIQKAAEAGVIINEVIMNTATFNTLINHPAVKEVVNPQGLWYTKKNYQEMIENQFDISIVIYDAQYGVFDETTKLNVARKFLPDGVVSLQPAGALGQTKLGTTPEKEALITDATIRMADYRGITVVRWQEGVVPVHHKTSASFLGMPSFEAMDFVYKLEAY